MAPSRRRFVKESLVASGALTLLGPTCERPSETATAVDAEPGYLRLEAQAELERRERELWGRLAACDCCPRGCGVDRLGGETGFCSSTARPKVYGASPHYGEERPLVGRHGSGTVFFSHCNLLCCFCQNWEINHRGDGDFVAHKSLARMMMSLQERGCHNINLVTPTHVVPHIVKALRLAIPMGLRVPLVYNTSGYDALEVIELLDGIVDIYLPDFKYQDSEQAGHYSSGASDYPQVAAAVIKEMHRQVGKLAVDESGIARRGLMIRHLVMPYNIAGTDRFVRWVAEALSPDTYVNIMAQYRPEHRALEYPKIARRINAEEWRQALSWAEQAGLTNLDR
jgi:putative pyruvate formate lyase activating enzyme